MFQLKSVPKEIDGIEFTTTQFPAMTALEVMGDLQRVASTANMNPNAQLSAVAPIMTPKMVIDLLRQTTALVKTPQGSKLLTLNTQENINLVFSGRLKILFDVIAHAIEVNFGDFNEGSADPAPLILAQDH